MHKQEIAARGIRFSINKKGREVARAYLYLLANDLHAEPFGLVEDVYVDETFRSLNLGRELLAEIISEAHNNKCYKLIATSRNDGTRQEVHSWYVRLGFRDYGTEFRMEL